MSEFSTLATRLVTPLLKRKGFKKCGTFDRSPTHDSALYRKGNVNVQLIYAFHPYDYPEIGIPLEIRGPKGALVDRLYPPTLGGIDAMLRAAISDLEGTL